MKRNLLVFVLIFVFVNSAHFVFGQKDEKQFGVKFSGYVKNDFYYDTREVVNGREGHLLFWPKAPSYDAEGKDINAHGSFHFLSIQTRLTGNITGPDALGAKTSAMFEGEFFGHSDPDINGFRLRHALIKLNWEKSELLTGQTWHPMIVSENTPGTVSFNAGLGFQPFSRNPQIKYTLKLGNFRLAATAFSERDFQSRNILGITSSDYIRNSNMPALNFNFNYGKNNNEDKTAFNTGFAVNYKTIRPSLTTIFGYITKENVSALSAEIYIMKKFKPLSVKFAALYTENASEMFMPGGFAQYELLSLAKAEFSYLPTRNAISWIDIATTGKKWQFGMFAGYNKNLGTAKDVFGNLGGLGVNIEHLYRVSPRVCYFAGKLQIGAEIEYTVAAYGDGTYTTKAIPQNAEEVANLRLLLGVFYHF
ncbi:MAG TPA: hypothetical protein PLG05_00560 [Bacteroidales bacterium]|nr:hypothetical protein [Bacteroidales bacterium]HOR60747.1 hypothetical protein [Bacteroidales bacterium]HPL03646.1 hypothetical protein [Bacteroidales bacterium]